MRYKLAVAGLVLLTLSCGRVPNPELVGTAESAALPSATFELVSEQISPSETPINPTPALDAALYVKQRETMVLKGVIDWGIQDEAVIQAMRTVPRHEFVLPEFLSQAYENHPLPIGHGQTISQPYIVALMTQEAGVTAEDIVLEIGTGSSYQAAVLAQLVKHVYTIEIIGALAEKAQTTLNRLGYLNVTVRHSDGYYGWEEYAPFDAIVVTAAPDHVPQPLVQQLKIDGNLIIPVGPVGGFQTLWRITRTGPNEVRTENLGGVTFVPLTRDSDDE